VCVCIKECLCVRVYQGVSVCASLVCITCVYHLCGERSISLVRLDWSTSISLRLVGFAYLRETETETETERETERETSWIRLLEFVSR
jgi:hypothetical protein